MSRESFPIPGLFGGVSQQIPAMRHATQCEEQVNMLSTTVDGLYTRPGTQHLGNLALTGANGASVQGSAGDAYAHYIPRPDGSLYVAVVVHNSLMVYNALTGAAQTVSFPNGKSYLLCNPAAAADSFAALSLADYTFLVNRTIKPAMDTPVAAPNPVNVAYVDVKVAVPNVLYRIVVDGVVSDYTTGTTPSQGDIADQLAGHMVTNLGAAYVVQRLSGTNAIKVTRVSGAAPVVTLYDTWDTNTMRNLSNGVPAYADLPVRFEAGYTVSIIGSADTNKDTYYVKWGGSGWVEAPRPGITTEISTSTMPHRLYQEPSGDWVFDEVPEWGLRLAGDEDTAPEPSFIGQAIQDVFFFRNRLGFLTGDSVSISRAGEYFDFFPRTATQVLDNDPVDLSSPVDGVTAFLWTVTFNQNLLVWTDTAQQLVLTSGEVMSPKTARLVPASTFSADPKTRPVPLGNRVIFAEKAGDYASFGSYRVAQDTVTNTAVPISDHVPRYVPASPRKLLASTSARMALAVPRAASSLLKLFKYEMDDDAERYTQKAWCDVQLGTAGTARVLGGHWKGHSLYLLLHYTTPADPVAGGRFASEVVNFQRRAVDQGLDYALCMDRRLQLTGGVYDAVLNQTTFTVPFTDPSLSVLRCSPGEEPYPLTPLAKVEAGWATTVTFAGNLTAAPVWAGVRYTGTYEFTEAIVRDSNGVPVQTATAKVICYLVRYVESSRLRALVTPFLRDTYTYLFGGRLLGLPGHGAGQSSLSTGDFRVPVGAKAAGTKVRLETSSVLEVVIPYAEWVGEVTRRAQRK